MPVGVRRALGPLLGVGIGFALGWLVGSAGERHDVTLVSPAPPSAPARMAAPAEADAAAPGRRAARPPPTRATVRDRASSPVIPAAADAPRSVADAPVAQGVAQGVARVSAVPRLDGCSISGRVLDQHGRTVPQAHVLVSLRTPSGEQGPVAYGTADETGHYKLRCGQTGPANILARHAHDAGIRASVAVELGSGTAVEVDLVLRLPLRTAPAIVGTVRAVGGERLPGATVRATWGGTGIPVQTTADARGEYALPALRPDDSGAPWITVAFSAEGYENAHRAFHADGTAGPRQVDGALRRCVRVRGRVRVAGGGAIPEDTTVWYRLGGDAEPRALDAGDTAESGGVGPEDDGTFEIEFAEAGTLDVHATAPGLRAPPVRVTLAPPSAPPEIELVLDAIPVVRIVVRDARGVPLTCPQRCGGRHLAVRVTQEAGAPGRGARGLTFQSNDDDHGPRIEDESVILLPTALESPTTLVVGWRRDHRIGLEVAEDQEAPDEETIDPDWAIARIPIEPGRIPTTVTLRRMLPVLVATLADPAGDVDDVCVAGSWEAGTEQGGFVLDVDAEARRVTVRRLETAGSARVAFTLYTPGWRPLAFGPAALGSGETLPPASLVFTRD